MGADICGEGVTRSGFGWRVLRAVWGVGTDERGGKVQASWEEVETTLSVSMQRKEQIPETFCIYDLQYITVYINFTSVRRQIC